MKQAEHYSATNNFAVLLQGPPGGGKTTLTTLFPKLYIADCDNNLSGVIRRARVKGTPLNFSYDTINVTDDGQEVPPARRWERLMKCVAEAVRSEQFDAFAMDGLTSISQYCIDYILEHKAADKEKGKMTISDWVPYQNLLFKFITSMRAIPDKYIIWTCHEELVKDIQLGTLSYRVDIPTRLQNHIGGMFSDVWRCGANPAGDRVVLFNPTSQYDLKNSLVIEGSAAVKVPTTWEQLNKYFK